MIFNEEETAQGDRDEDEYKWKSGEIYTLLLQPHTKISHYMRSQQTRSRTEIGKGKRRWKKMLSLMARLKLPLMLRLCSLRIYIPNVRGTIL